MTVYLALDGDKVGAVLESLFVANDEAGLRLLSHRVSTTISKIEADLALHGFKTVMAEGDGLLARGESHHSNTQVANAAQLRFTAGTGIACSAALAPSLRAAFLGLKEAKAQGGDCIIIVHSEVHTTRLLPNTPEC